jgi:hypothetical protein
MKLTTMLTGAALLGLSACTATLWQQIETTVETDVDDGVILGDIETAVATLDPQLAGIAGAVDTAIQTVIDYLEASGKLTPAQVAGAETIKSQIKAKLAKLSSADRGALRGPRPAPSPEVVACVARELAR